MRKTVRDFDMRQDNIAMRTNREILRVTADCACVREVELRDHATYELYKLVPDGYFASSIEVYMNGAANIFLRQKDAKHADKVITVRPE